jgi:SAM-dependent methyltransferase
MNPLFDRGAAWYRASTPWTGDHFLLSEITRFIVEYATPGLCVEVGAGGCDVARAASSAGVGPWLCTDTSFGMLSTTADFDGWKTVAEGGALPVGDGAASTIACRSALHYVGAERALREWCRALTPEGAIVIAQKVADDVKPEIDWYRAVQSLRSVIPREWYFTEDLHLLAERAGLKVMETAHYRGAYRTDLWAWASRRGVLPRQVAERLMELAERGRDPEFNQRIDFSVDGPILTMSLTWCLLTCRPIRGYGLRATSPQPGRGSTAATRPGDNGPTTPLTSSDDIG